MLLAAAAVAYMLTVTVNDVPTSMIQMPSKGLCAKRALDIMLSAPTRGPVVQAECTPLGPETEDKPASGAEQKQVQPQVTPKKEG